MTQSPDPRSSRGAPPATYGAFGTSTYGCLTADQSAPGSASAHAARPAYEPPAGTEGPPSVTAAAAPKSVGVALLLSVLFGPVGMLYSTVSGALVMIAANVLLLFVTLGYGWLLTWPICIFRAASAVATHNGRVAAARQRPLGTS